MKDTAQIALEVARKILGDIREPDSLDIKAVQAAIEKARQDAFESGWCDGRRFEREHGRIKNESRPIEAAHASEQGADLEGLATKLDWVLQHTTTFNDLQTRENLGAIRDELFTLSQCPTRVMQK